MSSTPWKQMLCEEIYNGHSIEKQGITQLGYSTQELCWLYAVTCIRCNKTSIVTRYMLDDMLFKDYDQSKQQPDEPDQST